VAIRKYGFRKVKLIISEKFCTSIREEGRLSGDDEGISEAKVTAESEISG